MWTPQGGYQTPGVASPDFMKGPAPTANPFMVTNPKYNPADPMSQMLMQDPGATAKPVNSQWTSPNGLTTTGVMNPFGLDWNSPSRSNWAGVVPGAGGPGSWGYQAPAANPFQPPPNWGVGVDYGLLDPRKQPTTPFAPFGFGNTDPVGDARRKQAMIAAGLIPPGTDANDPKAGRGVDANTGLPFAPTGAPPSSSGSSSPQVGQVFFVPGVGAPDSWIRWNGTGYEKVAGPGQSAATAPGAASTSNTPIPTNVAPPPNGQPATTPAPYSWLQGVTSANPFGGTNPTNPSQFATPQTAADIAKLFGQTPYGINLSGPGNAWSQPMQMFGPGVNAGLAADLLNRYGSAPGSYGFNLVNRDVNHLYGAANDPWATHVNPPSTSQPTTQGGGGGAGTGGNQGGYYYNPTTSGGGSFTPGVPNIFLPPPNSGGLLPPQQIGGGGTVPNGVVPPGGFTPDQFLADYANNTGYLQNIAANLGMPVNALPAWQAMIDAQQRQQGRGFANLQASFAGSGNRFSTDFGNAATDYWTQAMKDQNSLLGQMTYQSLNDAMGRNLQASSLLGQQGFQGASQLSNQGFQSQMQGGQYGFLAQQGDLNRQLQAALQFGQMGYGAASQIQQGAIQGATGLFNTENAAAMSEIQRQLVLQQLGIGSAQTASQLWQSNLGLGNTIGQGQYGIGQQQSSLAMQEWLRTQPQYNPLLQYMFSGATGYQPLYQPSFSPDIWQSLLGASGGILAALPGILRQLGIGQRNTPGSRQGGGGGGGGGRGGGGVSIQLPPITIGGGGGGWPGGYPDDWPYPEFGFGGYPGSWGYPGWYGPYGP